MRSILRVLLPLVLSACGSPQAPASPPSPAAAGSTPSALHSGEDAKKKTDEANAKRAAAIDALTDDEAKKIVCDADHKAALEAFLAELETKMKAYTGEDGKPLGMQTVDKRVVALSDSSRSIQLSVTGRGTQVHVFALAARDVSLDVLANRAAATTMRSALQQGFPSNPPKIDLPKIGTDVLLTQDSRQVDIKPGQPLEVRLSGRGCAILAAFQKP